MDVGQVAVSYMLLRRNTHISVGSRCNIILIGAVRTGEIQASATSFSLRAIGV